MESALKERLQTKNILSVKESLLSLIMCAPKGSTVHEVECAAGPSGTSGGWKVSDGPDYKIQCQDCVDREHWLLVC